MVRLNKQHPVIHHKNGFWLEWFNRRRNFEVIVYKENPDGTRGNLVVDLDYPRFVGIGYNDFDSEAIDIAMDHLKTDEEGRL